MTRVLSVLALAILAGVAPVRAELLQIELSIFGMD